jgi:hypothetical protein
MARIIDLRVFLMFVPFLQAGSTENPRFTSVPSCRAVIVAMAHQVIALRAYPRRKAGIPQRKNVW